MRKLMFLLVTVGILGIMFAPNTFAGKKPPKRACYTLSSTSNPYNGYTLAMATKFSGMKIRDANGLQKLFNIIVAIRSSTTFYNATGSGYWDKTQDRFEGNIVGSINATPLNCDVYLDESPYLYCYNNADSTKHSYDLTEFDCKTYPLNR